MKKEHNTLFISIKNDDLNLFASCIINNENLTFGRFPILTLCYLYNANKILKNYADNLLNITNYKEVEEPFEIYTRFKTVAKRCLRLYVNNQIVSSIEMLAILHKDNLVKKYFSKFEKDEQIINNLKTIYKIHAQKTEISQQNIYIEKRFFSSKELYMHKFAFITSSIIVAVISLVFLLSSIVTGFGFGGSAFNVYNQTQLLSALESSKSYVLKNDITVTSSFNSINFNGNFDGNGYTIFLTEIPTKALINVNNGLIENLNIIYTNSTINEEDLSQIAENLSLFVGTNNGKISNVSITVKNLLSVEFKNFNTETFLNGFANTNNGTIKNCSFSANLKALSNTNDDCFFSAFAGSNSGVVSDCVFKNSSTVTATDVDVTGIVNTNLVNGSILNCKNYAEILHNTNRINWSPNASGIALNNYGLIKNCYNYGAINASSMCEAENTGGLVYAGGICSINYAEIDKCLNKGQITAKSKHCIVYAGGICAYSTVWQDNEKIYFSSIKNCGVDATILVETLHENEEGKNYIYISAGGISGYLYGNVINCYSIVNFSEVTNSNNYYLSSCIGSEHLSIRSSTIENWSAKADNNFCLMQENISYTVSAGIVSMVGLNSVGRYDDVFARIYENTIRGCEEISLIKNSGVYWDD